MKLSLKDLKVRSFVTHFSYDQQATGKFKGQGFELDHQIKTAAGHNCPTDLRICDTLPEVCRSYIQNCEITSPPICVIGA